MVAAAQEAQLALEEQTETIPFLVLLHLPAVAAVARQVILCRMAYLADQVVGLGPHQQLRLLLVRLVQERQGKETMAALPLLQAELPLAAAAAQAPLVARA